MEVFDNYSEQYDQWYEEHRFAFLSEVEAFRKAVPRRGRGLEIGVGTGRFAQALGIGAGIDPSESMLRMARERGIKVWTGKGEHLPFPDGQFDFIVMAITFCFLEDPKQALRESVRVLRKDGKLIIGIVDRESGLGKEYQEKKKEGHRFYRMATFYTAGEIKELMEQQGFRDIVFFQTVFGPLDQIKKVEEPKEGCGQGGFVVLCGKKS